MFQPSFWATALAIIHRAANLEYLAVGILVQNLLDGNKQRRLFLAEGMSVAGTAWVHGARRESLTSNGISPPVPRRFRNTPEHAQKLCGALVVARFIRLCTCDHVLLVVQGNTCFFFICMRILYDVDKIPGRNNYS